MHTLGVDIGATKTALVFLDDEGVAVAEKTFPTSHQSPEHQIELLKNHFEALRTNYRLPKAIGIGVAGQIEKGTGTVLSAPNLKWKGVPLKSLVEKAFHAPTTVLNDVRAAAWGEWRYGAGKGSKDLLCLFLGTGIGGAFICEGILRDGASNTATEVGHMIIDLDGRRCSCGQQGCWETIVGGWGIAKTLQEAVQAEPEHATLLLQMVQGNKETLSARHLFEAQRHADPLAQQIIKRVSHALVVGTASLINAFNPARLVVGGGIFEGYPEFVSHLQREVPKTCLQAAAHSFEIVEAKLKGQAVAIGAAAYAKELT